MTRQLMVSAVERTSSARTGALWQRFEWRVEAMHLETLRLCTYHYHKTVDFDEFGDASWFEIEWLRLCFHIFSVPFFRVSLFRLAACALLTLQQQQGNLVFTSRHGFKPWLAVETKVFCEMYPCRLFGGTACCWYVFLTGLTALHRARAIRPQNESALDIVVWKEEMGKLWETMFFLRFLRLLGFNHNSHSPIHPFLAWHLHFDFDSHGFSPARPTATGWTSWMWHTSSVLFSS